MWYISITAIITLCRMTKMADCLYEMSVPINKLITRDKAKHVRLQTWSFFLFLLHKRKTDEEKFDKTAYG